MSVIDTKELQTHFDVLNEVLDIQKAGIKIYSKELEHKLSIHKRPVEVDALNFLAGYFNTTIVPASSVHKTPPYIRINTMCSDIIIPLKIES